MLFSFSIVDAHDLRLFSYIPLAVLCPAAAESLDFLPFLLRIVENSKPSFPL